MKTDKEKSSKRNISSRKKWLMLIVVLLILGCIIYKFFLLPPDLSKCNRVIIQYHPNTYIYFLMARNLRESVLSKEEIEYAKSFSNTLEVTDMGQIKYFAQSVSLARFKTFSLFSRVNRDMHVHVDCYDNNNLISSFYISIGDIFTEHGLVFKNPFDDTRELVTILFPQDIRPLQLRSRCSYVLSSLYRNYLKKEDAISYHDPNQWCDAVLQSLFILYQDIRLGDSEKNKIIREHFICPSVLDLLSDETIQNELEEPNSSDQLICHYAMNPNCIPDSPDDMVLLFETKDGWNQHGGPELFTFDNHEPKGGCVLLNDGTVKFIRTEEELNQLRWSE